MPTDLIRLMQSLFLPVAERFHEPLWQPSVDVYRTCKGWVVKFELAGVRPEDIEVVVSSTHLTVRGARRDWLTEEGCSHYRMEISYSHFERTLELPCDLTKARVTTEYDCGLLLVRIETEAGK
jgi:HSP20 family protein